ncbi:MAG: hypothetical protein DWQ01_17320 [Planctomycetota bacterium]|nr:MAG: hypothetical protein DWQ01_17320 [Planctomycetota bacterium]
MQPRSATTTLPNLATEPGLPTPIAGAVLPFWPLSLGVLLVFVLLGMMDCLSLVEFWAHNDADLSVAWLWYHALMPWAPWWILAFPLVWMNLRMRFRAGAKPWLPFFSHLVAAVSFAGLVFLMSFVLVTWVPHPEGPCSDGPAEAEADFSEGALGDITENDLEVGEGEIIPLEEEDLSMAEFFRWAGVTSDFMIYLAMTGLLQGLMAFRTNSRRRTRELELQSELAKAQWRGLQMQLNPHFLFNSLNGIGTLIGIDPKAARQMLQKLADLLRLSLQSMNRQEVRLDQELAFVKLYLQIQEIRFGSRLQVKVESEAPLDSMVPARCLQPLVENAVVHGVERTARPCAIHILAGVAGVDRQILQLEVLDNGNGFQGSIPEFGVGLSNTRSRLRQLYGEAGTLEIENRQEGGVRCRLRLPFYREEPHGEGSNS